MGYAFIKKNHRDLMGIPISCWKRFLINNSTDTASIQTPSSNRPNQIASMDTRHRAQSLLFQDTAERRCSVHGLFRFRDCEGSEVPTDDSEAPTIRRERLRFSRAFLRDQKYRDCCLACGPRSRARCSVSMVLA